jgi:hypothetical protein
MQSFHCNALSARYSSKHDHVIACGSPFHFLVGTEDAGDSTDEDLNVTCGVSRLVDLKEDVFGEDISLPQTECDIS